MDLVRPRHFHRLGLAVHDVPGATAWFDSMFGAVAIDMFRSEQVVRTFEGSAATLQWVGGAPFFLMGGDMVARLLERHGPGVQSWAWDVDDNWEAEHLVRDRGIEVIGVDLAMRVFFMHPAQCHGLLIEWCDGKLYENRQAAEPGHALVEGAELAWVTAVVDDADAAAAWFSSLAETKPVVGKAKGPDAVERTVDFEVGDITVRLVTPRSPESRYAPYLSTGPRLHSFTMRVPDLDTALDLVAEHNVGTVYRDGDLAATDPAATHGLRIDWTQ